MTLKGKLPESYRQFKLHNGLRVITMENKSLPLCIVTVHVNTGYCWEPDEIQGVSHVVEHNLMHASEKRKDVKIFSNDRRRAGAFYDAGTSYEYTEYLIMVPKENLSSAMDILCDGFGKPVFDGEIFKSEMGAIKQESRRKHDMPQAMAREKLYKTACKVHRLNRWRLGEEEVLDRMTPEDLDRYFEKRYGPGNYVLVVAGDIDHDSVEKEVRETFGKLPAREVSGEPSPAEPPQEELRYMEMRKDVGQVYWMGGFHSPKFLEEENTPLELLAIILGRGFNSRLNMRLREKEGLVDDITVSAADYDEHAMFVISMKTDAERLTEAEKALVEEILKVREYGVTGKELERARNIFQKDLLFVHDDLRWQVGWMCVNETRKGSFLHCEKHMEEVFSVTSKDIMEVANKYLKSNNLSVCTIIPEKADFKVRTGEDLKESFKDIKIEEEKLPEETFPEMKDRPVSLLTPAGNPLDRVDKFTMSNEGRVILLPNPRLPIFSSVLLFGGGKGMETEKNSGITSLMVSSMLKGTKKHSAAELLGELEEIGTTLTPVIKEDSFGFALKGMKKNFSRTVEILREILLQPAFSEKEIEIEKRKALAKIKSIEDQPRSYSHALFSAEIFKGHPYGLSSAGISPVITSLEKGDILQWYEKMIGGKNMVLSVGGDLTERELSGLIKPLVEVPPGIKAEVPPFIPPKLTSPVEAAVKKKRKQTSTLIGYVTVPRNDRDFPVFEVIRGLTTGDGGRFWNEIRGKRGLAYVIHSYHLAYGKSGKFLAYAATSPDKADLTEELLLKEYRKLYEEPPTEEHFEWARNYILGLNLVMGRTTYAKTLLLGEAEAQGSGTECVLRYKENINEVTVERLKEVAEKYFEPGKHYKVQLVGE